MFFLMPKCLLAIQFKRLQEVAQRSRPFVVASVFLSADDDPKMMYLHLSKNGRLVIEAKYTDTFPEIFNQNFV